MSVRPYSIPTHALFNPHSIPILCLAESFGHSHKHRHFSGRERTSPTGAVRMSKSANDCE
eukprot:13589014-Alexandrium_andersonii.AAC.1